MVCVDRLPRDWKGDSVTVANEGGAYRAASLFTRMGHKQIAVITGPLHLTNAQDRLAGFKRALGDAGIRVQPDYIQEATFDREGGYSKTLILLRMLPRPTAIFATNNPISLIAIRTPIAIIPPRTSTERGVRYNRCLVDASRKHIEPQQVASKLKLKFLE